MAIADATGTGSILSSRPTALLPPIPLYRRILRAHKRLPVDYRVLADKFVKQEWNLHKIAENPIHIVSKRASNMDLNTNFGRLGF